MYLLYFWHGILKIKHGRLGSNFYPDEGPYPYHTNIPDTIMEVQKGKILCPSDELLPQAISMLEEYRQDWLEEWRTNAVERLEDLEVMAAKKKIEELENIQVENLTMDELIFIKNRIRANIIRLEGIVSDGRECLHKTYDRMSPSERASMKEQLEMCYSIFDKFLAAGVKEV